MKTIVTKYYGPTNTLGARIVAKSKPKGEGTIFGYDHALSAEENHNAAALRLMDKLDWSGVMRGGGFAEGTMVWVFDDDASPTIVRDEFGNTASRKAYDPAIPEAWRMRDNAFID